MGRYATRTVFATALCAGVAMVGASVNGMLGVDAELQRSAVAAQQFRTFEHVVHKRPSENETRRVIYKRDGDCGPPRSNHLS
jgi:hypothetical protein